MSTSEHTTTYSDLILYPHPRGEIGFKIDYKGRYYLADFYTAKPGFLPDNPNYSRAIRLAVEKFEKGGDALFSLIVSIDTDGDSNGADETGKTKQAIAAKVRLSKLSLLLTEVSINIPMDMERNDRAHFKAQALEIQWRLKRL